MSSAPVAAQATPQASAHDASRSIGWGLIGASFIAATEMIPAFEQASGCHVAAVMSSSKERGEAFAATHGIPCAYTSVEQLLDDDAVDAVYVSTTNDLHHEHVLAAAAAGKHVLCEKPLSLTLEQASEMVAACEEAGVVMGVNHHIRATSWMRELRRLILDGAIGEPLSAHVRHIFRHEHAHPWRTQRPEAGGGAIFDLTVHDADTLRFVFDSEIAEVTAFTAQQGIAQGTVEDTVLGAMRLASGVVATFHDSMVFAHPGTSFEVHGTEAAIIATDGMSEGPNTSLVLVRDGAARELPFGREADPYLVGVEAFNAAVRGEGAPLASGEDGVRSLAVALVVREAAGSGCVTAVAGAAG